MNSKGGAGHAMDAFAVDFSEVQEMRREQKVQFKEIDQTKEYAETQYYKVKFRNESQIGIGDHSSSGNVQTVQRKNGGIERTQ